jgi:uncharacterized membrane protein YkvA (DUF1232 family)
MDNESNRDGNRDEARALARETARAEARERAEAKVHERLLERRAREREADIKAGRAQRGLFTGRGRRDDASRDRDRDQDRDRDDDRTESTGFFRSRRPSRDDDGRGRPRTGAKRSVMKAITQLPSYLRLLLGLISDSRVSKVDRFFVIAAAAYIISPIDFVPDIIPFFGEVDDVFLLMIALQRLVNNAGRTVLLAHWRGDPEEVHNLNFARIISAAGFFLPSRLKRRLFKMVGGGRKRRD